MTFIVKASLRAIARNKVRSFLTTLGIIIGVAAVIAMVAIGQGATAMVKDQIARMGTNLLMVNPGSSGRGGGYLITPECPLMSPVGSKRPPRYFARNSSAFAKKCMLFSGRAKPWPSSV